MIGQITAPQPIEKDAAHTGHLHMLPLYTEHRFFQKVNKVLIAKGAGWNIGLEIFPLKQRLVGRTSATSSST